jgi:probable rRNA maturation factor
VIKVDCEKQNDQFSALASVAYEVLSLVGDAVVEVEYIDSQQMHELNLRTRNVDRPTDVLSYPALDEIMDFTQENYPYEYDEERGGVFLGSIVICESIAREQANEYGHSFERENCYLFVHGLMHLLGYDHIEEEDRKVMRENEESVLLACGIGR